MLKLLPIGISDFKAVIDGNYAYIDKTLLIQELIEKGSSVVFIPRLRRFGKTLNLSMLRYFFEKSEQDTSYLFKSLNIWKNEQMRALQGQFPVIFLTLKDVKYPTWEETFDSFCKLIANEFIRHQYLMEGEILSAIEKESYKTMLSAKGDQTQCASSLFFLAECLHRYHKKKVVLLIDEYDTPAHSAFIGGFYESLISFLRNWLSGALKDNPFLERGVMTGILRIAKESIFSGLNNVLTYTILNEVFQDKFGLLESEVKELLETYELGNKHTEIKQWYNGYRIGNCEGIYNPWSVLMCIKNNGALAPYWVNTSDNALVKRLITRGTSSLKEEMEELLKGGIIEKTIEEGIILSDLDRSTNAVWSLLLFSGYLTLAATPSYGIPCQLRIPNVEVGELYKSMIYQWFDLSIEESQYHLLLNSLIGGDIDTFSQLFQEFLASSVSVFDVSPDEPEKIYHAFVLGMLLGLRGRYEVKSNRESGYGRYDVMLLPHNKDALGIIMEFKKIGRFEKTDLESAVISALNQIETKNYRQELLDRGVKRMMYLGLAFEGKRVLIRSKLG